MAIPAQYLALFKEWYAEGGIRDQINNERLLYDLCRKSPMKIGGKFFVIPVVVGRNQTPNNPNFGGVLNAPGNRRYVDLLIDVVPNSAGVVLQDDAIKRAAAGDKGAFVALTKAEVDGCIEDIKNFSDRQLWTGGLCKGLLNEHKASLLTTGAAVGGGVALGGINNWEFSGSTRAFQSVVKANTNSWVRVDLVRLDNIANPDRDFPGVSNGYTVASVANGMVVLGGAGTIFAIFVSDISNFATLGFIELTIVSDVAGTGFTTAVVQPGVAIGLQINPAQFQTLAPANFGTAVDVSREPQGILSNLFTPTCLYGVGTGTPRQSANPVSAADNTYLQSTAMTNAKVGAHARGALDKTRFQDVQNQVFNLSGTQATGKIWITTASQRSKYYAVLTQVVVQGINFGQSGGKMDGGVVDDQMGKLKTKLGDEGYGINGVPVLVSQHAPTGIWFYIDIKSWFTVSVGESGWFESNMGSGDMFTAVMDPTTGRPTLQYAAYWIEYYNAYCEFYIRNAALCGVEL